MACEDVRSELAKFAECVDTPDGCRVTTHCVYPSFDPVKVFVTKFGDGFHVHDGAGASRAAWIHGRDDKAYLHIMERHAKRFGATYENETFASVVQDKSWLMSAILAVANTSASAANAAVEYVATAAEKGLKTRIDAILTETVPAQNVGRAFEIRGKSGKIHEFDFIIRRLSHATLIDAIVPHHVSISSKYVAFADSETPGPTSKYAVYDRDLDPSDSALMQQVADLVPYASLRTFLSRVPENGR